MRFVRTAENLFGLPAGFQRVAYLESTGTQYIDTGFKLSTGTTHTFSGNIMWTQSNGIANFFYGYRSVNSATASGDMRAFFIYGQSGGGSTGRLAIRYGVNTDNSTSTISLNKRYTLSFDGTNLKVDGTTFVSKTVSYTPANYQNMYLFWCNCTGYYSDDVAKFSGRIYNWQIFEDGVAVRDFIPCIDPLGVPCMYDLVGKKPYYNAGSGTFEVGRQVIPVEYLQSSGTQYIDTGYKPNNTSGLLITGMSISNANQVWIGSREDSGDTRWDLGTNIISFNCVHYGWNAPVNTQKTITTNQIVTASLNYKNDRKFICGNVVENITGTLSPTQHTRTAYLFTWNIAGSPAYNLAREMRMYNCVITEGSAIVRDFIPCKDENDVGFMFDKVSGTCYLNAGTGAFIVGENKYTSKLRLIKEAKELPAGYKRVEYLQSTGTQYIDTGYKPNTNTRTVGRCYFSSWISSNANYVFGVFESPNNYGLNVGSARQYFNVPWGTNSGLSLNGLVPQTNKDYEFDISKTGYKINGTSYGTISSESVNSARNMYLFWSNGTSASGMNGRIYYLKIWDNGVLVRDFIPVLDSDGIPALYDKVNGGTYYNQGTGNFTYGHTITPVEYLESTGTQRIDTGVSTVEGICTEAKFKINAITSTSQVVFGKVGSTTPPMSRYWFGAQGSSLKWYYAVNEYITTSANADADIHTVVLDTVNNVCTLDGETIATFSDLNSNSETISLFSVFYQGSLNNPMSGRIYYTKIWNNGTLVRDFIPVRDENNVGYMFDEVTGQMFGNAGSGSFGLGNDLPTAKVRFIQDVLPREYRPLKYLESTGTQYIDTGYKPNVNTVTEMLLDNYTFSRIESFFGVYSTDYRTNCYHCGCYESDLRAFVNGSPALTSYFGNIVNGVTFPSSISSIKLSNTALTINGTDYTYTQNPNTPLNVTSNMILFGYSNAGTFRDDRGLNGKVKSTKIWDNGVPVRDFYPALRKSDNKPGMYDRITKQFFVNAAQSGNDFNYE